MFDICFFLQEDEVDQVPFCRCSGEYLHGAQGEGSRLGYLQGVGGREAGLLVSSGLLGQESTIGSSLGIQEVFFWERAKYKMSERQVRKQV